ncbi:ribonuclease T2 [Jannaschia sp. LMIT008]|uniref:ribonuclease T2 n=1 Tax=Jannaschia maritima TaxID=3032585 RepID=UPI0028115D11|nr:ribonuclease T2 [Jannaschia sp. LMIT008]
MRGAVLVLAMTMAAAATARAEGERAGVFDYWVLALSWSPSWCAAEGSARGSPQCESGRGHGWVLHGLWPQYERGWPAHCPTVERAPSGSDTAALADLYGTSGSAWHQWNKHGTCSGLAASDYYALSRRAYDTVTRPPLLRELDRAVTLPAAVVEDAFLEVNPDLSADGLTVTCREGRIREVRICLDRMLSPRRCGADVIRDCTLRDAAFPPIAR